jgi:hypothetical protein
MESFFESVVSLSPERAHQAGFSLEEASSFDETSSIDEEEEEKSLSSPLTRRFFNVTANSAVVSFLLIGILTLVCLGSH